MLSIEEISDRLEIQQLLIAYSTAIDSRRFDDLDQVFTTDAYIDYRAMGGVDDPAEGPVAAAAINTVQLICGAFGAGLAGVVVNHSATDDVHAARVLFIVFAALAGVAVIAAWRATRRDRPSAIRGGISYLKTGVEK